MSTCTKITYNGIDYNTKTEAVFNFLIDNLNNGPVLLNILVEKGRQCGFKANNLFNVGFRMHINVEKRKNNTVSIWSIGTNTITDLRALPTTPEAQRLRDLVPKPIETESSRQRVELKPTSDDEIVAKTFAALFGLDVTNDDGIPHIEPVPSETPNDAQQITSHGLLEVLPDESVSVALIDPKLFPLSQPHVKELSRVLKRNGVVKISSNL